MSKEYERAQVGKIIYELDKENSTASIVGQDNATEEYSLPTYCQFII